MQNMLQKLNKIEEMTFASGTTDKLQNLTFNF